MSHVAAISIKCFSRVLPSQQIRQLRDIRSDPVCLTRNQRVSFDEPGRLVIGTDLAATGEYGML
jgi:hypothetical protein